MALAGVVAGCGLLPASAGAEHAASRATFRKIDRKLRPSARTLHDHLASVELSDQGPYALAHEVGGQGYRLLLRRGRHGRWRLVADVTEATDFPCGAAPRAVVRDLHVLRYVPRHRCVRQP